MQTAIEKLITHPVSAAPLATFRIGFGILMVISILRFWMLGWIEKLYITPKFHFSYYGFEWVKPFGEYTYLLFVICGLSAFMVALGWKYRLSILIFFLSFTYIELMDKTTYLNHYYFISCISFMMIFLPLGKYFSIDYIENRTSAKVQVWTINSLKLMVGIVYFYAGLAKLHKDWLVDAMPLKLWLPGKYDLPVIGPLLEQEWLAYAFSWGGAAYDLLIPFALLYKPTRKLAFVMVVIFHVMTRILFPIGMFPFIMIVCATIFFSSEVHEKYLNHIRKILSKFLWCPRQPNYTTEIATHVAKKPMKNISLWIISIFIVIQLWLPFRHYLYPDNLFWSEEGFRYSWRVMLMEKAGNATFKVVDGETGDRFYVNNADFLSSFQEKQMSTQPDFIVEYAHYLRDHFNSQGHKNIEIYVDSYVALNGERSRRFISPEVDLTKVSDSFKHKDWILPFEK